MKLLVVFVLAFLATTEGCHNSHRPSPTTQGGKPLTWKLQVISQLKQHGIENNVIDCVIKKLGLQDPVDSQVMLYKPVPSILRRFKRYLERMVVIKEPIDPKHCQGRWLEICEHVETCQKELTTQYTVHHSLRQLNQYICASIRVNCI